MLDLQTPKSPLTYQNRGENLKTISRTSTTKPQRLALLYNLQMSKKMRLHPNQSMERTKLDGAKFPYELRLVGET